MNASEQAKTLELTSKIAATVNLFKSLFPDARADLKPWKNDDDTKQMVDPDSIDLGFHFPGWSPRLQGRSLLVQIRLYQESERETPRLVGIDIAAFNHAGIAWKLSTIEQWELLGKSPPAPEVAVKFKQFCQQVFELFQS